MTHRPLGSAIALLMAGLLPSAAALAQGAALTPADREVRLWAATCMTCHGSEGFTNSPVMSIGGRPEAELSTALLDYKHGRRTGTIMHQHAKGYSDAELKRLAHYFSQTKRR